jgi:uncharacterized protein
LLVTVDALLLAAAGLLAGAMNAMAGGGSFASFPALIAAGVPPVVANTSSAVALYPGGAISAWVFRRTGGPVAGVSLLSLAVVTVAGGLAGAVLLVTTPATAFDHIVPWLLLAATLALAFGRKVDWSQHGALGGRRALLVGQFLLGLYGGYFGGAAGIMMVAFWTLVAGSDAKAVQAQRTLLVTSANSAAVLFFAAAGVVDWTAVLIVAPAALVGGYAGALIGLRLAAAHVRFATIAIAAVVTAVFFVRAYA